MFKETTRLHKYNLKATTTKVLYTSVLWIGNLWPTFIPHWQRISVS